MRKLIFICLLALCSLVRAETVGIDIGSHHFPQEPFVNNFNPGVYVKFDNGFTTGLYYNSVKRTSVFAGYSLEAGPFGLLLGGVTGYQYKRFYTDCPAGTKSNVRCWQEYGHHGDYVIPLISPSVTLGTWNGVTPRLSFIPAIGSTGMNVVHLSVEHKF